MAYEIITEGNATVIADTESGFRIRVLERKEGVITKNTAYCMGTLYRLERTFTQDKIFIFQALTDATLEMIKAAVDFFFRIGLETELYVKEVPRDSALFGEEALLLFGPLQDDHFQVPIAIMLP